MSKAFTRESDELADLPEMPRPASSLPPGAKNYLTPAGEHRLRAELNRLLEERPRLGSSHEEAEARRQAQSIDQRIYQLQQSLHSAVVVTPPGGTPDSVRFGTTVVVRGRGSESQYRIVGVDETDLDQNWVSWLSPIAKALLNARAGQRVRFKFPSGEEELEIVSIAYKGEESH